MDKIGLSKLGNRIADFSGNLRACSLATCLPQSQHSLEADPVTEDYKTGLLGLPAVYFLPLGSNFRKSRILWCLLWQASKFCPICMQLLFQILLCTGQGILLGPGMEAKNIAPSGAQLPVWTGIEEGLILDGFLSSHYKSKSQGCASATLANTRAIN
jgi:hypothetical protein